LRDPKLALVFAKKSAQIDGKDAEIQEILAEAYWFNGDRSQAVQSIQQSLALIEQTPTPTRQALEKTLHRYQSAKLPYAYRHQRRSSKESGAPNPAWIAGPRAVPAARVACAFPSPCLILSRNILKSK